MHDGSGSIAEYQKLKLAVYEAEAARLSTRLREMLA